jgi:hypothetical protein
MDAVFGTEQFRNEVVWERTTGRKSESQYGRVHDIILFYTASQNAIWNPPTVPQNEHTARGHDILREDGVAYRLSDFSGAGQGPARRFGDKEIAPPNGRHWQYDQAEITRLFTEGHVFISKGGMPRLKTRLQDLSEISVRDVWTDIRPINAAAAERIGYPTQKPEALLERIIQASSNEGDPVLDPFCGCGTSAVVSERLHRPWIGIDITYVAINVMKQRFEKNGLIEGQDFTVRGIPKDVYSAGELAKSNPYEFQIWCISQLPATQSGKPSGDKGVDGFINFKNPMQKTQLGKGLISVKGGQTITPSMVQELVGAMQNHSADFGILITLKQPTGGMKEAAGKAGVFDFQYSADTVHQQVPKVQLLTVEDLFKKPIPVVLPGNIVPPFKTPPVRKPEQKRIEL